jgi:hypothetical protein
MLRKELIEKIEKAVAGHPPCNVCRALLEIRDREMKVKNEKRGGHASYAKGANTNDALLLIECLYEKQPQDTAKDDQGVEKPSVSAQ